MLKEKELNYRKAYVELYEIINVLSKEQKEKIPEVFIKNIKANADTNYYFKYDITKTIFEQNLMVETFALLIEIYERYLAPFEEKEIWEKYDKICLNKIEEEKRKKYHIDVFSNINTNISTNVSSNNESEEYTNSQKITSNNIPVVYQKETILKKIVERILRFFKLL